MIDRYIYISILNSVYKWCIYLYMVHGAAFHNSSASLPLAKTNTKVPILTPGCQCHARWHVSDRLIDKNLMILFYIANLRYPAFSFCWLVDIPINTTVRTADSTQITTIPCRIGGIIGKTSKVHKRKVQVKKQQIQAGGINYGWHRRL